ncbi:23S rRNA (uracil(1939)-C(5))-methyltransferase RlmD [Oceanobacillus sp. J11TS1]|uniref:23S rRNA (uracil(1939)-C(5))-methyltransferase RlmD n=1 Tax=Oceanobacillus sp. J11TS1 TaxID=2807191 RepID=UPI001B078550|nr:23S rRNA (uracil(1939)-C(5))-methyltransferase RlmD [Oceanobacillus sp. J11TS1]GIO22824.1 23S rRNA (uracil-C(5))-methyltransferase RlmCD [Oceanobacillus sp. J11TS1]
MAKTTGNTPVQKNEQITITIEDLTHEGNGVGKVDGYPLFIPNTLPGEEAVIKVVKANKKFGFGKLLELKTTSPERIEPTCHVHCGGCQLQHMSYALQLKMKQDQVHNVMKKVAHLEHVPVHPIIGMEEPSHYRNKIQIPVDEKNGELIMGYYQKRSHRIIENQDTCQIHDHATNEVLPFIRQLMNKYGVTAYDETSHRGQLRHIMIRTGHYTNEMMVVFVTRTAKLPGKEQIIEELTNKFPFIRSIVQNINDQRTNVILGKKTNVLWGTAYIHDKIGDLTFAISPKSFYQVNPVQTKILYDKALEYAKIDEDDIVIDAYCGIGTISLFLAQKAKKVYGIEVVPEAIEDAKKNAERNGIDNVEFTVGQAEKVMPVWKQEGLNPDVIVVDPPRKGCDPDFLEAMIAMEPKRIVYVSCNPSTLARDLRILEDGGYETKEVQPVDMFPNTGHVETITWLELADV